MQVGPYPGLMQAQRQLRSVAQVIFCIDAIADSDDSYDSSKPNNPLTAITLRTRSPAAATTARPPTACSRRKVLSNTRRPSLDIWLSPEQSKITHRAPSSMAASSKSPSSAAMALLISPCGLATNMSSCNSDCMSMPSKNFHNSSNCSFAAAKVRFRNAIKMCVAQQSDCWQGETAADSADIRHYQPSQWHSDRAS